MDDAIKLRFKLDDFQKIKFGMEDLVPDLFKEFSGYINTGIAFNSNYYDELCKNTITNGHSLLKSEGIYNLKSTVVNPMAEVIGQYLFRVLFNDEQFHKPLHEAKQTGKRMEIILEFDMANDESKLLAGLPWELMFCPKIITPPLGLGKNPLTQKGFFVSKEAFIYRNYKNANLPAEATIGGPVDNEVKKTIVSIAFLVNDVENLFEVYSRLKAKATEIENNNKNIQFKFINPVDENKNEVGLLAKKDLEKIFLREESIELKSKINKVVHLICDIGTEGSAAVNTKAEYSLYFKEGSSKRALIPFDEVIQLILVKQLLPDPALKMLIIQSWKDLSLFNYSGFEDFITKDILFKQNSRSDILSMPYVLKQDGNDDGNEVFFESLYTSIILSLPVMDVVQKIRNDIMPDYSYGFPILYSTGKNQVVISKSGIEPSSSSGPRKPLNIQEAKNVHLEIMELLKNLKSQQLVMLKADLDDQLNDLESVLLKARESNEEYTAEKLRELLDYRRDSIKMLIDNRANNK